MEEAPNPSYPNVCDSLNTCLKAHQRDWKGTLTFPPCDLAHAGSLPSCSSYRMSTSPELFKEDQYDPVPTIMDAMQKRDAELLKKVKAAAGHGPWMRTSQDGGVTLV